MGTIEINYLQQVISYALSIWELYFGVGLDQPKRVELVDPDYFDGVMKKEISLKRNLYKINSCNAGKIEVMLLRDKWNFKADEKIILIRHPWFPGVQHDEDDIKAKEP